MPATLQSVTSVVNEIDVEIDGDPQGITVSYTTRRLTPRTQREISKAIKDGDEDSVVSQFVILVSKWNFAPEPGKAPIPLTKDALQDVPLETLGAVLDAITDSMTPKEETETS